MLRTPSLCKRECPKLEIMGVNIENASFDELEPEISYVKGVPGLQTGRTPPRPIWRPLPTGRRVLRTIIRGGSNQR